MTYPTRKNLIATISPTPYANPLLLDLVSPSPHRFFLGVAVSGVFLVGSGGAGAPYSYSIISGTPSGSPPINEPAPGLFLNTSTGEITGTPSVQGTYHFIAQVEDSASNVFPHSFSINVEGGLTAVVFQPTIGENGIVYRFEFIVRDLSGTTITSGFSVSVGTLPDGLALAGGSSNVVTGTPTALAVGTTQVTITVSAGGATLDIPCTFTIADAVALTFIESIDPPNGWGGGAGSWLPSVQRGIPYVANLSISGGVGPYSVSLSTIDPWPTGFSLLNQVLQVVGKTLDTASATTPKLSAVTVTDALGSVYTAQRAYFIINQPNARIQPQQNGVDAAGGDGAFTWNFIDGTGTTAVVSNDGATATVRFDVSAGAGVSSLNGATGAVTETAADGSVGFVNTTGAGGNVDITARLLADAATTTALPACTYANGTSGVGATLTGNSNGALAAQDGVTLTLNQYLLVKNQASGLQNGRYKLTQVGDSTHPFILTRSTRMDLTGKFLGALVFVVGGSTQASVIYSCTNTAAPTVGTTAITFQAVGSVYTPPVTTKGDLFGFSTVPARVPVGTNKQFLIADSTQALGVKYTDLTGGISFRVGRPDGAILAAGFQRIFILPASYDGLATWELAVFPAATCSVDIQYHAFGGTRPTTADSIVGGAYPATTAGLSSTGTTSGWTNTAPTSGGYIAIYIHANDLASEVIFQVSGRRIP